MNKFCLDICILYIICCYLLNFRVKFLIKIIFKDNKIEPKYFIDRYRTKISMTTRKIKAWTLATFVKMNKIFNLLYFRRN